MRITALRIVDRNNRFSVVPQDPTTLPRSHKFFFWFVPTGASLLIVGQLSMNLRDHKMLLDVIRLLQRCNVKESMRFTEDSTENLLAPFTHITDKKPDGAGTILMSAISEKDWVSLGLNITTPKEFRSHILSTLRISP